MLANWSKRFGKVLEKRIVALTGEVDSAAQIENAKRFAENVKGVRAVRSNLAVKGQ